MAKQRNIKHEIKAIRKLLKNNHDTLSRHEIDEIQYNLYKKERIYDFLKNKYNLNDNERRVFKRIPRYLKKLGTNLSKRGDYQKNYLYGIDRLFDEDIYYKPFEVKSTFNGNYVLIKVMVMKLDLYLY